MSPLVHFVLRGLRNCYLPDRQCWSYIYHLDGREQPNESYPAWDAVYSLNVILGLAILEKEAWQSQYDVPRLLRINARRLFETPVPQYAYGMALWAAAALDQPLEPESMGRITGLIKNRSSWGYYRA